MSTYIDTLLSNPLTARRRNNDEINHLHQQGPSPSGVGVGDSSGTQELAAAVDDLLVQLQKKFDGVSSEIFGKCESVFFF